MRDTHTRGKKKKKKGNTGPPGAMLHERTPYEKTGSGCRYISILFFPLHIWDTVDRQELSITSPVFPTNFSGKLFLENICQKGYENIATPRSIAFVSFGATLVYRLYLSFHSSPSPSSLMYGISSPNRMILKHGILSSKSFKIAVLRKR